MNLKLSAILLMSVLSFDACAGTTTQTANPSSENKTSSSAKIESDAKAATVDSTENTAEKIESNESETVESSQTKQPRTVRDFFNLLPQNYFPLESCEPAEDKNCERARRDYVKSYLEVEDTANGYWKSSCDGAQRCLRMALFKRHDNTYVVGVHTLHEADETNYFLEYRDGRWFDISAKIVPEFSERNIYELPRYGTTVKVFKKNFPEPEFSERGAKMYDLQWKEGKLTTKQ